MAQLTEKTFFYYVKCPKWVQREVVHGHGLDALEHLMIDDGLLPEMQDKLVSLRGEYEVVRDEDQDDAFARTMELMRQGAPTIYGGVLIDGHWVGRPDLLERVEGKSAFGDYYYVAVDIKRITDPRGIRDAHKLQGSFYAELLERIQNVKPTSGYIMSPEGVVMRYDIERFEADYRLALDGIERILAGEDPSHVLTSGCKASPYFAVCVDEAQACDELSLLNRIHTYEIEELEQLGVSTVLDLATANLEDLQSRAIDLQEDRIAFLQRQAIALKERVHDVVSPMELPTATVELFFDIEADPIRDVDYLFGVLKVVHKEDGSREESYRAFTAEQPEDEERAWNEFTEFLNEHRHAPVYHYGWYEVQVCNKLLERYGAPEGAMQSWQENFYDLNTLMRSHVIFPLSFYSLKDIAQYLGFNWRAEDAGGVNSIRWYHEWLDSGRRDLLEKVIQYNEDDVMATKVLKEWLAKHVT